jgi:hypothetical protein
MAAAAAGAPAAVAAAANRVQTFAQLGEDFAIEEKMIQWLTSPTGLNADNLDDFLHSAATENDVGKLAELANADNVILTTSRLRQAWRSLKRTRDDEEVIKKNGLEVSDLDGLLAQPVLDNLSSIHFARYKLSWPPEVMPSDTTVSRVVRELDKRMLSVCDALKVRTQTQQQRGVRKRTKLGDGMEVIHNEAEQEDLVPSVHNYLQCLLTLLIAYSIAGCKSRSDAPVIETKGTDSTKAVQCPLDTLMRYYYRVHDRANRLGNAPNTFQWIKEHDESERGCWVDRIRNSDETLGEIIQSVFVTREAMWETPAPSGYQQRDTKGPGKGTGASPGTGPPGQGAPAGSHTNAGSPGKAAAGSTRTKKTDYLRDGTELCRNYNAGRCRLTNCARAHKCSVVKASGRTCGGSHTAKDHK